MSATAQVLGRLTRNPETRQAGPNNTVCKFSLAWTTRIKRGDNYEDKPNYLNCEAWNGQGEVIQNYLSKGMMVYVSGDLEYQSWQDGTTGETKSTMLLRVNKVELMPKTINTSKSQPVEDESASTTPPAQPRRQPPATTSPNGQGPRRPAPAAVAAPPADDEWHDGTGGTDEDIPF
jgi:single-strand DNA-binding protein